MPARRKLTVPGLLVPAFAAALTAAGPWGTRAAVAEACAPHCDYAHYYGPYDFSYARRGEGLFGWPRCDANGDCAPDLGYTTGLPWPRSGGRITVRLLRVAPRL